MSFWGFVGILTILGVMVGSLFISKYATNKELEEQQRRMQIRGLRNDLIDIDELLHTLFVYDRNAHLLEALAKRMEKIIIGGLSLIPDDEDLKRDYQDLEKINIKLAQLVESPQNPEIPSSDRQTFLIKKQFVKAIKLIKQMNLDGTLDELASGDHQARLRRNSLVLEVQAYQKQGYEAKAKGELSSAANFFKHAKELLINSEISFADKTEQIQMVSKDISALYVTVPEDQSLDKK